MSVSFHYHIHLNKTNHIAFFYSEQSSKDTVRQLLVVFINTIFELDILFSKNDNNTGIGKKCFIKKTLFNILLDKYNQLTKYISTFFNASNDDKNSNINHILSYGQQQTLHIQETFFKSNIISSGFFYQILQTISDCEPIDLTEYESRQQQLVQSAVEKWLQT
jgi:hypothetical protein